MRRRNERLVRPDLLERGAAWVERDDAAGVERGLGVVQLVEVGVRHREGGAVLLDLAVERQPVAVAELAPDVVAPTEPDGLQGAAALVGHAELEPRLAAHPRLALRRHGADHRHRLQPALDELTDGRDGAPVQVAPGVVPEEIAEGRHAGLAERLGAALAHARELLDVGVEDVRGGGDGRHATNYRRPLTDRVTRLWRRRQRPRRLIRVYRDDEANGSARAEAESLTLRHPGCVTAPLYHHSGRLSCRPTE